MGRNEASKVRDGGTQKVVLVLGVFDLFHRGHLEFIKQARSLGDKLVVAVNTDEKVASYKRKPVINTADRMEIISALRYVDHVDISDSFSVVDLILKYEVDIVVHGDDWSRESYLKQVGLTTDDLLAMKLSLVFVPYYKGVSTSGIMRHLKGA